MEIVLLGDIMIHARAAEHVLRDGPDELVERLKSIISPADVAIGNFETMILPPGS